MDNDVEYLSEWPPSEGSIETVRVAVGTACTSLSPPPSKRQKHELQNVEFAEMKHKSRLSESGHSNTVLSSEELRQRLSSEEIRIVHSHHSISADALLARWWKITAKAEHGNLSTYTTDYQHNETIVSVIKSNAGPQTQLFHISR